MWANVSFHDFIWKSVLVRELGEIKFSPNRCYAGTHFNLLNVVRFPGARAVAWWVLTGRCSSKLREEHYRIWWHLRTITHTQSPNSDTSNVWEPHDWRADVYFKRITFAFFKAKDHCTSWSGTLQIWEHLFDHFGWCGKSKSGHVIVRLIAAI